MEKPSIPLAYAVNTKETYETMVKLPECINYKNYDWKICSDLKIVDLLCGMQEGYTIAAFFVFGIAAQMIFIIKQSNSQARTNTVVFDAFAYIRVIFTHPSYSKTKVGVCAGPEIKKLLKDNKIVIVFVTR